LSLNQYFKDGLKTDREDKLSNQIQSSVLACGIIIRVEPALLLSDKVTGYILIKKVIIIKEGVKQVSDKVTG
jgi:hypothetical protein